MIINYNSTFLAIFATLKIEIYMYSKVALNFILQGIRIDIKEIRSMGSAILDTRVFGHVIFYNQLCACAWNTFVSSTSLLYHRNRYHDQVLDPDHIWLRLKFCVIGAQNANIHSVSRYWTARALITAVVAARLRWYIRMQPHPTLAPAACLRLRIACGSWQNHEIIRKFEV